MHAPQNLQTKPKKSDENPFVNNCEPELSQWVKIYLVSLFILPLRIVLMGLMFGIAYIITTCAIYGAKTEEHLIYGWRRKVRAVTAKLVVIAHYFAGFFPVRVRGQRASPQEAPILVLAPHTTFFDILPYVFLGAPSLVVKAAIAKTPCIGHLLKLTAPIWVDRNDPNSRKATVDAIRRRAKQINAKAGHKDCPPQIFIFPEATCTNKKSLIKFKPGAFLPKLPVQPVCLRWTDAKPDTLSWSWEGTSVPRLMWYTLCNLRNHLEIEYLPVYHPSDAEKADAELYASNVRDVMATSLQLPVSDYSVDDVLHYTSYSKPNLGRFAMLASKIGLLKNSPALNGHTNCFRRNVAAVCENLTNRLDGSATSRIKLNTEKLFLNVSQFAQFCGGLVVCDNLQRVFNLFDWEMTLKIDIREFILCLRVSDGLLDPFGPDFIEFAYTIFADDSGKISLTSFIKMFRFPLQQSIRTLRREFRSLRNAEESGHISYGIGHIVLKEFFFRFAHEQRKKKMNSKFLGRVLSCTPD